MKVRAAIVLGWLCVSPVAWAAKQPAPPSPTLPPTPTVTTRPTMPAAPVPTPTPSAPAPKDNGKDKDKNGKDKDKSDKDKDKNGNDKDKNGNDKEKAPPPISFTLANASNNVTPYTQCDAKTEEGKIDVSTENNVLKVVMTGGVGANVFIGCESVATQCFQLVQEFEIASSDEKVREVTLAIDVGLVGFVRSKHKASACVQGACVTVYPLGGGAPLTLTPNRPCVAGPNGHCVGPIGAINKDPLPTLTSPPLPLGRYVLQADLLLQATAAGFLDAHSTAIFSPEPKELDPWEREHDPYKGEDKAGYGLTTFITATPAGAPATSNAWRKHLASQKKKKGKNRVAAGQPPVYR